MAFDAEPSPLERLFLASVDQAIQAVTAAPSDEQRRSLRALEDVEPSGPAISDDEFAALAATHRVDSGLLEATAEAARLLAMSPVDTQRVNKHFAERLDTERPRLGELLHELRELGQRLQEKFNQYGQIAAIMPSFVACEVACDIRIIAETSATPTTYVPVALVRIKLDEGRDAVFQCNLPGVARLQKAMQAANVALQQLNDSVIRSLKSNTFEQLPSGRTDEK